MTRTMRRHFGLAGLLLVLAPCVLRGADTARDNALALDRRVDALLARMTLEEKVAQLTQISGDLATGELSPEQQVAVREGRVGSILNNKDPRLIHAFQRLALEGTSRLRLPLLFGYDVIHGYRTVLPIPLGEAASFDPRLAEQSAAVAAREARAAGIPWVFAPMVDIARDARWGRIAEGAGEDPFLGRAMAAARVHGFQGADIAAPDRVAACVKHYVAYGAAEAGRDYNTVDISERTLRTVYLPPFKAAVDAGVASLMSAFNDLSGVPCTANRLTLTDILRGEWAFTGPVVSDWKAVGELVNHRFAATPADATREALLAGVDMDMVAEHYPRYLPALVAAGRVPEARINEAARRVLRLKMRLGLFERCYADPETAPAAWLTPAHRALAREAARRSIVLLKNEGGLLPLARRREAVAVLGPLADSRVDMLGSWTADGRSEDVVTVLDGIRQALGPSARVLHAQGCPIDGGTTDGIAEAAALAKQAGLAVLVVGEAGSMSGEAGSRAYLDLPGHQRALIEAVHATGVPFVVVLMSGRPLTITREAALTPALLEAWFPGVEAGHAVADVLFGDVNPGAKLPVSFPRTVGQVPLHYDGKSTGRPADLNDRYTSRYLDESNDALFPFGHGLSYTTFTLGALRLSAPSIPPDGRLAVSVDVTNTGRAAGDEVVQLYIQDVASSVTRPVRELAGFERVSLMPSEKKTVTLEVGPQELGLWDRSMRFVVEPGAFRVWVGQSSVGGLEGSFRVE